MHVSQKYNKTLSEALILASTNRQYDDRLFIELQVQYMKIPSWGEHSVYRNCFWHSEQFLYTTCSPHVLQKEELLTKIYLYNLAKHSMKNCKIFNECGWQFKYQIFSFLGGFRHTVLAVIRYFIFYLSNLFKVAVPFFRIINFIAAPCTREDPHYIWFKDILKSKSIGISMFSRD